MWLDSQIELVLQSRSFKTNVHHLANETGMDDYEAQTELSSEILNKRFSGLNPLDVIKGLEDNDPYFTFKVTYARKDIERRLYKDINRQKDTINKLQDTVNRQYLFEVDNGFSKDDIERVIDLLPDLYKNTKTQLFVATCLRYGKAETMIRLQLTPKQFHQKLRNAERYSNRHREKFNLVAVSNEEIALMDEQVCLIALISCLESCDYTDDKFQSLLDYLADMSGELIGQLPGIKHQAAVLEHWTNADVNDKYTLVNGIYERLDDIGRTSVRGNAYA